MCTCYSSIKLKFVYVVLFVVLTAKTTLPQCRLHRSYSLNWNNGRDNFITSIYELLSVSKFKWLFPNSWFCIPGLLMPAWFSSRRQNFFWTLEHFSSIINKKEFSVSTLVWQKEIGLLVLFKFLLFASDNIGGYLG